MVGAFEEKELAFAIGNGAGDGFVVRLSAEEVVGGVDAEDVSVDLGPGFGEIGLGELAEEGDADSGVGFSVGAHAAHHVSEVGVTLDDLGGGEAFVEEVVGDAGELPDVVIHAAGVGAAEEGLATGVFEGVFEPGFVEGAVDGDGADGFGICDERGKAAAHAVTEEGDAVCIHEWEGFGETERLDVGVLFDAEAEFGVGGAFAVALAGLVNADDGVTGLGDGAEDVP